MTSSHPGLRREHVGDDDEIVVLTLTRDERRNALDASLLSALDAELADIDSSPRLRAVVLTGEGRAFCAGADLKASREDLRPGDAAGAAAFYAAAESSLGQVYASQDLMSTVFERIHRMRQPVIAAVNGAALGGGFALALACDVRIASTDATWGAVFIRHGVSGCDMGASYHLPRLVGAGRAAELLLTGRVFGVEEAERIGLVTGVVEPEVLLETALAKASEIAQHSALAVWMTKQTLWHNVDAASLRAAIDLENRTQVLCTTTGDLAGSFGAFRDGSARPEWKPL